ncbi:MAG: hypothetical protein V8T87_04980 [Victivallales bacterium]
MLVKGIMDYDGFYRFTMKFRPDGAQNQFRRADGPAEKRICETDSFALQPDEIQRCKIPAGKDGVICAVRRSARTPQLSGSFRPYVWISGTA